MRVLRAMWGWIACPHCWGRIGETALGIVPCCGATEGTPHNLSCPSVLTVPWRS